MAILHNGNEYSSTKIINYSAAPDYNRGVTVDNIQSGNYQATDNGFLMIQLQSQQSNPTKVSVVRSKTPITDTGTEIASIVLSQYQYSETLTAQVMARDYYKLVIEGVGNPQVISCMFYPYASNVPIKFIEDITMEQVVGLESELAGKQDAGDYATNTALNNGLAGKQNKGSYFNKDTDKINLANQVTGALGTNNIANDAITNAKIANSAVTATKIADSSVSTAKIADGAVTSAKIAAKTIVAGDIADNTITATQIAANAVTVSELANNAVVEAKIASNAVTTAKIKDASVTDAKISGTISKSHGGLGNTYGKADLTGNISISSITGLSGNVTTQQVVTALASKTNYIGLITTGWIWKSGQTFNMTDLPYNPSKLIIHYVDTNGILLIATPAFNSYAISIGIVNGGTFLGWKALVNSDGTPVINKTTLLNAIKVDPASFRSALGLGSLATLNSINLSDTTKTTGILPSSRGGFDYQNYLG